MKITPLDIDQQQFQRVLRGCDPKEVHDFLDQVSRELEEVIRDNNQLKEALRASQEQLEEYKQQEASLREALVAAGRMTEEIRETARKEAELIRAQAELEAEKILQSTQDRAVELSEECRGLREQKARLVAELRAVLDSHSRLLDTHDEAMRMKAQQNGRRPGVGA